MLTWIVIVGLFLGGTALYGYLVSQERQKQETLEQVFNEKVDVALGTLHTVTDSLKSRMSHAPKSEFDQQLQEAMKDNP
jgi:hypothetical protein